MSRSEVLAAMRVWREGLVNLSSVNRLIKFRATKTGALIIEGPDPEEILLALRRGDMWDFAGRETAEEDEQSVGTASAAVPRSGAAGLVLQTPRPDKELGSVLRNMMRRANAEYLDRGLSVLYLAFGMLHWQEEDGTAMSSPLLLVPVHLESQGPNTTPKLQSGDDDTVLNPSLVLRLRDFGVELPVLDDIPELSMADLLREIRGAVSTKPGWRVEPSVVLSTFSFHKEAMFKDLQDNEDVIIDHPVVRALSTRNPADQTGEFIFDPVDPADIDNAAPPEHMPLVLDADSSQRAAIAAALAGRSFVMDGPPGTGKSQTIANMIGALLHAGKSVLFVSEKAAALEVVRNRLADAGLEGFLLELHSHKASRKEVASTLAHCLDNVTVAPRPIAELKRTTLLDRRLQLNSYAAAMNEVRQPLQISLHEVLGMLARLVDVPSAPVPETAPTDMTQEQFQQIKDVAVQLKRSWRPALQGQTFLWREVTDDTSLDIRLYQAESALEELIGIIEVNQPLMESFSLHKPSDNEQLASLLELQHQRRPANVPDRWLTTTNWTSVTTPRERVGGLLSTIRDAERAVSKQAGVPWDTLPDPVTLPALPARISASQSTLSLTSMTAKQCADTAKTFSESSLSLRRAQESSAALAAEVGLPDVLSFSDAERLTRLVDLAYKPKRPCREWFDPATLAEARTAATEMKGACDALDKAEQEASAVFAPAVLDQPVHEVLERFTTQHRGFRKLLSQYRADKKLVATWLNDDATLDTGIQQLQCAADWFDAVQTYETTSAASKGLLGKYFQDRSTDFVAIDDAFVVVDEAIDVLNGLPVPSALAAHLSSDAPAQHQSITKDIRSTFAAWKASLAPEPAPAGRPELALKPIQHSIDWLGLHIAPLQKAATRIEAVDRATGRERTLRETDGVLELRDAAATAHRNLAEHAAGAEEVLESHYAGVETDLEALDSAIGWASELRAISGQPLTDEQLQRLAASTSVTNLRPAMEKWAAACERIIAAFDTARHRELAIELDDYTDAKSFIEELRADSIGQDEWFEYTNARKHLEKYGLGASIDFCIEQRVEANLVPRVVERALLRSWADKNLQRDARLRPLRAADRDALIEEYRTLDKLFIDSAVSEIITNANHLRPTITAIGEPGIIRREGMKKSRHLPVRELIGRTRNTSVAIKPCFMMSPLAVSQYLPNDMNFDVVIFDEASQVRPGDAINCIYRGRSLILAGDDKQLPPTSFFERVEGEEGTDEDLDSDVSEFQSVLELAKGSGGFNNLRLNWHYRSRHEDLIAFSNYKFYDGSLVTYPSASDQGADVGVEFIDAAGTYRRGGGSDNPIEAAKVAERVLHHFTTRPNLTLGVVTFSTAQSDAINDAVAKARENRRDLDRFFDENDRLNAFFVKSLESVQGDERDVILFSIGYGPDEAGKVTTNFGVLNKPKGWRRLNVAITRARQRVEVVASMRSGQIPPSENENVGYLRSYLDYAERGTASLALNIGSNGLGPESPFEESVMKTVQDWGYIVEPQVGSAGFRIDLGVRHPALPGMFAIGVECDGYQYHSAPAARDRDRLRDAVLTGLGWRLHRIWGTAWYRNRADEEKRLRTAIEHAVQAATNGENVRPTERRIRPDVTTALVELDELPSWASEYKTGAIPDLPRWLDPSDPSSPHHMAKAIKSIASIEGPVHIDVVQQRLKEGWGFGRLTPKIKDNIDVAICESSPEVKRDGNFLDLTKRDVDRVRAGGDNPRKAEHVHLSELKLAITMLLRDSGITPESEVIVGVKRVFGWTRAGAEIARRVADAVEGLIRDRTVVRDDHGDLRLASSPTASAT
ncbi:DUF3320 domain-containing protein [Mycolicibacterium mengxianglii]|uniref:DUF3320 domain-containing protein n=1 Tax=Mycolicibacterium mengxianglii TaxID=2736649 RepID=UPI0018D02922|nr:DUF3320 domain-containing protein [Mycolicibacterium mengxianglii]